MNLSLLIQRLGEDSMFTLKGSDTIFVKVSFVIGDSKLMIEKWAKQNPFLRN